MASEFCCFRNSCTMVNKFKRQASKQDSVESIESHYGDQTIVEDEPLEKAKVRAPPGINASLVFLYAVFLLMFTIGVINLNNCPTNGLIPIYLIVAGSLGALAKVLSKVDHKLVCNIAIALLILDVFWNILGTVWVFREYQPNYNATTATHELYCDRTTFLLAFWILIIQYTLLGTFIVCSLCYMLMRNGFEKT